MDYNGSCSTATIITTLNKVSEEETKKKDDKIIDIAKDVLSVNPNCSKSNKSLPTERKVSANDDKIEVKTTELLGSVTTHTCPGTRTSARVIQKMKLDLTRPTTPPPIQNERDNKKDDKSVQKTPSQLRPHKTSWSNLERNYFFDGLNEFGKDFEAVGNYINAKLKRKSSTDISYKTKDQVRQHYYQTYHKICKYVRFSDEIKKLVQELYTLINYGEMRRKLQFVTDKHFMKLKHLVYRGHITVRCKGKNIRVKTPSCRALRKLNQLDDSLEDIRLPSKIEVIISPANMESFGRVQSIAQNPRVRTTVPLQKKLINFIKTFEAKWQFNITRLPLQNSNEKTDKISNNLNESALPQYYQEESEICFLPKPNVIIHRPLLSITEYLSSVNLCLAAYEERMGIQIKSETLCMERLATGKRQRTDSGSEKKSPDIKKQKSQKDEEKYDEKLEIKYEEKSEIRCEVKVDEKSELKSEVAAEEKCEDSIDNKESDKEILQSLRENHSCNSLTSSQDLESVGKSESSGDELSEELNTYTENANQIKDDLCIKNKNEQQSENVSTILVSPIVANQYQSQQQSTNQLTSQSQNQQQQNPLQPTQQQQRSKRSSQLKPVRSALNFKPLINDDIMKRIRNGWTSSNAADITIGDLYVVLGQDSRLELDYYWKKLKPFKNTPMGDAEQNQNIKQSQSRLPYNPFDCDDNELVDKITHSSIGNKLKHLLIIANLSDKIRKRHCSCGHICERNSSKPKIEREYSVKSSIYNRNVSLVGAPGTTTNDSTLFRHPYPPVRRPIVCPDPSKQLQALTRQKMSRHVLVQRLLMPGAGGIQPYDILDSTNSPFNKVDNVSTEEQISIIDPSKDLSSNNDNLNNNNNELDKNNLDIPSEEHKEVATTSSNLGENILENQNILEGVINFEPAKSSEKLEDKNFNCIGDLSINLDNPQANMDTSSCLQTPKHLFVSSFDEGSNTTNSIFNGLFRDTASNSRWLEENFNDFSLTSLLGHLDEISSTRDPMNPSSNISVISESSVDYRYKFQEISALMQNQDKDKTLED